MSSGDEMDRSVNSLHGRTAGIYLPTDVKRGLLASAAGSGIATAGSLTGVVSVLVAGYLFALLSLGFAVYRSPAIPEVGAR